MMPSLSESGASIMPSSEQTHAWSPDVNGWFTILGYAGMNGWGSTNHDNKSIRAMSRMPWRVSDHLLPPRTKGIKLIDMFTSPDGR